MRVNLPIAADGNFFGPHLVRSGSFQVGPKSSERKFTEFQDALSCLKSLPKAYWRRPNQKGKWGIVTEVAWKDVEIA